MSKPTSAAKTPTIAKQPAKAAPAPDVQGGVALADVAAGALDLTDAASLQGQADRLNNARLQAIQRQLLVGKIGQQQGNGHLQQVMAFAKQSQGSVPYQPHTSKAPVPNNGNANGVSHPQSPTSGEGETDQELSSTEELAVLWDDQQGVAVTGAEPPPNPPGAHPPLQRQPEAPAANQPPTEEEKAAAKAKAAAARAAAAQAQSQGQTEQSKSQARKETEKSGGQAAKAKADAAKAAAPPAAGAAPVAVNGATAKGGKQGAAPALNGAAPSAAPGGDGVPGKAPASAAEDPAFQGVLAKVKGVSAKEQGHASAGAKAQEAQAAAESPASELAGKAQSNQVGEMAAAETPGFDAKAFKAKLMARIQELTPKNAEDADEFKEQNKAGQLKGELQGETAAQKAQSQAPLAAATEKTPDAGSVEPKPTTPLQPNEPGPGPGEMDASGAAPKPKSQSEVEAPLQQQSKQLDQQMSAANVTEEQLAKSNEPEFQGAVAAKKETQAHAQSAPQAYRQDEQGIVQQAQAGATATAQAGVATMHNDRATALAQVDSQQGQGKSADEKARAEVGVQIQSIYDATQSKVDAILSSLDSEVDQLFNEGAEAAKQTFERYVDAEMEAYKEERYGGLLGWGQWLIDKLRPTQPEVLAIFQRGRQEYIDAMDAVIDNVVALIGRKLAEAKAEIANGKQEIQKYVTTLPANLQQVGQEAAQNIQSQFEQLEQGVDAKQGELIDKLANQYNEKLQAVDARIEQLKAENATLYDKAADAVGGVIKTILQLKDMLLNVLARAAAAIEKIIADPIGFLGNLIAGVKQGLGNFVSNIGQHMKEGFIGFLTGAVAGAGITLPQNWDLAGIFEFVMQILGLSFESLIGKVSQLFGIDIMSIIEPVKQIIGIYQEGGFAGLIKAGIARLIGEERMAALLQVWDMIQIFISGNWAKLWELIQEHLSNLKEMVFGKIEEFLVERVVKAGITWVVSLFNPAGAFIKACKMIYDVVMFFVERGSQIMSLVNAVIDSVTSIASGNVGVAASAIEGALAKGIPVAIGFLSSLLGLGNVSEKVQEIIQGVRGLVDKAINAIFNLPPVKMVVGFIKKVIGKITGLVKSGVDWAKGKVKAGVNWVKGKVKAGVGWVKEKIGSREKDATATDNRTIEEKESAVKQAAAEADSLLDQTDETTESARQQLPVIKAKYKLTSLELKKVQSGEGYYAEAKLNPTAKSQIHKLGTISVESIEELVKETDPVVASQIVASVTAARESQNKAQQVYELLTSGSPGQKPKLPATKTVAVSGTTATVSGWNTLTDEMKTMIAEKAGLSLEQNVTAVQAFYESNKDKLMEELKFFQKHPFEKKHQVSTGTYYMSHAEPQLSVIAPSTAIGVSRSVCADSCYPYLHALAKLRQENIVVSDPDGVWVFFKNGVVKFLDNKKES